MIQHTVYIPVLRDSDKVEHDSYAWDALEKTFCNLYGGFTRSPNVSGGWVDKNDCLIRDESRVYSVGVPSDKVGEWSDLVAGIRDTFDQQCIYVVEMGLARLI